MDLNTDYLKPEFFYTLLFKGTSVIINAFVISENMEELLNILDIFFRIDKIDLENMESLYDAENLSLLMETYQESNMMGVGDDEKKPLIFFPDIIEEMCDPLCESPNIQFIGIQSNKEEAIPYSDFSNTAIYDKNAGNFSSFPFTLDENSIEFKFSNTIIDMYKENKEELYEYLISIKNTVVDLLEIIFSSGSQESLDEMQLYSLMKDFTEDERIIIYSIFKSLSPDIEIGKIIPDINYLMKKIEGNLKKNSKLIKKQVPNKESEEEEIQKELSKKAMEIEARHSKEFMDISKLSNDFFLAFESVLLMIPMSSEALTSSKKYCLLRSSIWKHGIPIEFLNNTLKLFYSERIAVPGSNSIQSARSELTHLIKKIQSFSFVAEEGEIHSKEILKTIKSRESEERNKKIKNKKTTTNTIDKNTEVNAQKRKANENNLQKEFNKMDFNFNEKYNNNLKRIIKEIRKERTLDNMITALETKEKLIHSEIVALIQK